MIGTPCYGGMCFCGYTASLLQSKEYLKTKNIELETCFLTNESLIPRGRNTIVAKFMADPSFTHLLFIDADITWQAQAIELLVNHDKPIVGAAYPKKGFEWKKLLKVKEQIQEPWDARKESIIQANLMNYVLNFSENRRVENNLLEVKHLGTGFLMIKREVFETMMGAYPHTKYDDDINILSETENQFLYAFFDCVVSKETHKTHYLSEDYYFEKRAVEAGYKVYLDVRIPLSHTGTFTWRGQFLASVGFQRAPQPQTITTSQQPATQQSQQNERLNPEDAAKINVQ
jgi:hypothetical protein